jgi:SAM-dependent methyltransferase
MQFRASWLVCHAASMSVEPPASATDRQIRDHFDQLAEQEWERLVRDPAARASLEIHRRFLARFVRPGDRVLEIGAGPGRFTIELVRSGAEVVVTDVSPVQLELNAHYVAQAGAESGVLERHVLDVRDAASLEGESFDLALAYGGPLSYVFEDAEPALSGLLNAVRPGREVVASVMSLLGAWRHLYELVYHEGEQLGHESMDDVFCSGDLRPTQPAGHVCQMYRWSELRRLIDAAGGDVVAASASNWASLAHEPTLEAVASDAHRWSVFLDQEEAACAEPGALDGGTHLLFAARAR